MKGLKSGCTHAIWRADGLISKMWVAFGTVRYVLSDLPHPTIEIQHSRIPHMLSPNEDRPGLHQDAQNDPGQT